MSATTKAPPNTRIIDAKTERAAQSCSLPGTDILLAASNEGTRWATHVAKVYAPYCDRIRTILSGGVLQRAVQRKTRVVQPKERDHVILVHAVTRNADATHKDLPPVDGNAAGEDLNSIAQRRQRWCRIRAR